MTNELAAILESELDCGDTSCVFAVDTSGQRTNGGCRCFQKTDPKHMALLKKHFHVMDNYIRMLRNAHLEQYKQILKLQSPLVETKEL